MYHCTTDGMGEGKKQKHKHETETPDCGGNMIAKTLQLVVENQEYYYKKKQIIITYLIINIIYNGQKIQFERLAARIKSFLQESPEAGDLVVLVN